MRLRPYLYAGAGLVLMAAGAFLAQWVAGLFPSDREAVVLRQVRIIRNVQVKEVEKWKTRTMPCVDLEELVPRETFDPLQPLPAAEEKAIEHFQERFAGQVDLGFQALLATLAVPPGGRYGWSVAATIPRAAPPDNAARKVSLVAVENEAPGFSLGRRSSWFVGLGAGYTGSVIEPTFALGASRDLFSLRKVDFAVRLEGSMGLQYLKPEGRLIFAIGGERARH